VCACSEQPVEECGRVGAERTPRVVMHCGAPMPPAVARSNSPTGSTSRSSSPTSSTSRSSSRSVTSTASPSMTASTSVTPSDSGTGSRSQSASVTPSVTATVSPSLSASVTPSASDTASISATPSVRCVGCFGAAAFREGRGGASGVRVDTLSAGHCALLQSCAEVCVCCFCCLRRALQRVVERQRLCDPVAGVAVPQRLAVVVSTAV
jgi:hypothetical protein